MWWRAGLAFTTCAAVVAAAAALLLRRRRTRQPPPPPPDSSDAAAADWDSTVDWTEVCTLWKEKLAWGFCTVQVDDAIFIMGHHSEEDYYGYGLPTVVVYHCQTGEWRLPRLTGIPLIWWNICWLDCPELLVSPSMQCIFSPFGFNVGDECVYFDVLEVRTYTWRVLQCALPSPANMAAVHRFVHLEGFQVLALVYLTPEPDEDEAEDTVDAAGSTRPGVLNMHLLNLSTGKCKDVPCLGPAPPRWTAEQPPNACYRAPWLVVLGQPGALHSTATHCNLYMYHIQRNRWSCIADHLLPIPKNFLAGPQTGAESEAPTFARHFIVHAGALTCDVTYDELSELHVLRTSETGEAWWERLCPCDAQLGVMDCYCATASGVYYLRPLPGYAVCCGAESPASTTLPSYPGPITAFDKELLLIVFSFLGQDILNVPWVCQMWRSVGALGAELLDATWDVVPPCHIRHWQFVPRRITEWKLLVADLDEFLEMTMPPLDILARVYAQRFRLEWQRGPVTRGQNPYQWCVGALLQIQNVFKCEDDLLTPSTSSVVVVDRASPDILSEAPVTKMRYLPSTSSHFFMETLRQVTGATMRPNVVQALCVMPDAVVYAAYYSPDQPPLVEVAVAKRQALQRVLREAPTLAVVNSQQLMELAYVTASQPSRRADDQGRLSFRDFQRKRQELLDLRPLWRRVSLGEAVDGIEGPVVCFLLSVPRSLLLPYTVSDHVELFVK